MQFENTLEFAQKMDREDPLLAFRDEFYVPVLNEKEVIYLAGNVLGLQPQGVQDAVMDKLEDWASFGMEGFQTGREPWSKYHEKFPALLADIVGALPEEIAVANQNNVNLQLLFTHFYNPKRDQKKILIECSAPDNYNRMASDLLKQRGLNPEENIIQIKPHQGEFSVRNEDIIQAIKTYGKEIALIIMPGINYYTGQAFFMKSMTRLAHEAGIICGFDLSDAVGNIKMNLHEWEVDFACWSTDKYLNSGPGAPGGIFIHQKHMADNNPLLNGYFANPANNNQVTSTKQRSDVNSVLSLAAHQAALDIFKNAGFENVLDKGEKLSAYLIFILNEILSKSPEKPFDIMTPLSPGQRGSQISLKMGIKGKHQFDILKKNRVITAWEAPNVIRLAPAPLYNSFQDVFYFGKILEHAIHLG